MSRSTVPWERASWAASPGCSWEEPSLWPGREETAGRSAVRPGRPPGTRGGRGPPRPPAPPGRAARQGLPHGGGRAPGGRGGRDLGRGLRGTPADPLDRLGHLVELVAASDGPEELPQVGQVLDRGGVAVEPCRRALPLVRVLV